MPRKTEIGTEVAHVTRDSDTTFKVKRSKVNLQGRGHIVAASHTACYNQVNATYRVEGHEWYLSVIASPVMIHDSPRRDAISSVFIYLFIYLFIMKFVLKVQYKNTV